MQRISTPLTVAIDRFGMADMVGTAGEQKAFQRMVDTRIAIIGNGAAGRDINAIDDAGADIENGGFIEENAWRPASLKRTQDNLPVALKTHGSRKRY
ncbi:hypothetical protein D3C78_1141130 [compost metagenome]